MNQNLEERTTINFPKSLNETEIRKAFEYVSEKLGCKISGNFFGYFDILKGETDERYVTEMRAVAIQNNDTASFCCLRDEKNLLGGFLGIKLETDIKHNLDELPEKEIRFYDSIRTSLKEYFNHI